MDDDTPTTFSLIYIDEMLKDAQRRGHVVKVIRVGADIRDAFENAAGEDYDDGKYLGIPVAFDAIDPEGIVTETEPA